MVTMTMRELVTYLKSLPKDTHFPIGFGSPFIINNFIDQVIFRPVLDTTAGAMAYGVESLLGMELKSDSGARMVVQPDACFAYFGLDKFTVIAGMNLGFLTILRAMEKSTKEVTVEFVNNDKVTPTEVKFNVPPIWWDTLSKPHQDALALEYLTNKILGGFRFKVGDEINPPVCGISVKDAFDAKVVIKKGIDCENDETDNP